MLKASSLSLLLAVGATFAPTLVAAQVVDPTIIMVPYAASDPSLPHPAHSNARVTLKAILRNANCANGYSVAWDVNRNDNFNDDASFTVVPSGGSVYDIGRTFLVPAVASDTRMPIGVRVRNLCNNADAFGTFRLYFYSWTPGAPSTWEGERLQIMGAMGVQEVMWYLHRSMDSRAGAGAAITGRSPSVKGATTALVLWTFALNGHLPAYPPNTINWFGLPQPNGWAAANDLRWNSDPYAESMARFANWTASQSLFRAVVAADEDNTCGWNADRTQRRCNRIANTNDLRGVFMDTGSAGYVSYYSGANLGGITTILPAFAGTPVQVGAGVVQGQPWEWLVQQAVDWLGYMQIDDGCAHGGWNYDVSGNGCGSDDSSAQQWAYIGLDSADEGGRPFGVVVNNLHKYRTAEAIYRNQTGTGSAAYRSDRQEPPNGYGWQYNAQALTGGAVLGYRWLGVNRLAANDNTTPFAPYTNRTAAQLRSSYDRYVSFTTGTWQGSSGGTNWYGHDYFWNVTGVNGYLCGNNVDIYNWGPAANCGVTYTIYSHQKAMRAGSPEERLYGGVHDWVKQFTTYVIRAQFRSLGDAVGRGGNYDVFGQISDCAAGYDYKVPCGYGTGPNFPTAMAGLVATPTLFNPKPVATPAAQPTTVVEGCSGGNNGLVTFSHAESFHPNPSARIIAYQVDVDASNGLWWETGAAPDFVSDDRAATFTYRYLRRGNYTATLRVVDNGNPALNDQKSLSITVNAAANVAPAAAHGGPYIIEENAALQLAGTATDSNVACGDVLTTTWDLNNANTFNFANGPNAIVAWASMAALPRSQAIPLRIRVRDAAGLEAIAATTLTIYPANPVASGRANPNPAGCQQQIELDGSASFHPNPQRTIAQYQWNVDGQPGFEGAGSRFTFTYQRFGTYQVTLRVTDDLGRFNDVTFEVVVNQGNLPPVARTSQASYTVLEGANLTLDGRGSSDPNTACGDSIVAYEWDINGNGAFNNAGIDAAGAQPVITWAVLSANLQWPADQATGLPTNTITLRVRDSFGATGTVNATVTIYRALPIAVVVQSPDPTPINLVTGFSSVTLDGRESRSPIPGMTIVRYDWDIDCNDNFERQDQPTTELVRVYNPVPGPNNLPQTFVCLRVTDRDGRQATVRYQVRYRVPPTPPTADADPTDPPEQAYHILLGDGVTLDASQSFDPDTAEFGDYIAWYRWDLNHDPAVNPVVWDRQIQDANGDKAEAVLNLTAAQLAGMGVNAPGVFRVMLEVEDTTQLTSRDPSTLTVYARNPVAAIAANPNPAACGARITFDGSGSNHPHPRVDVVRYQWDLDGNGTYDDAEGQSVSRQFDQFTFAGPINVGLRVTDSNGNAGTTTVQVRVDQGNRNPVAAAGGPYAIARGEGVTLDGSGSSDPDTACGDALVRYEWDLRADGTYELSSANDPRQAVTAAQLAAAGIVNVGNYDVRLRVTDRFGAQATHTVQLRLVTGPTAVATATPNRVGCNGQVVFDGNNSTTDGPVDQGFRIESWAWDFDGDGVYETNGARVTRNVSGFPGADGIIRVTVGLRVTDASGRTATTTVTVQVDVDNVAPVANAGGPYVTGRIGAAFAPITLDARASFDPNAPCDSIARYEWDTDGDGLFGAADVNGAGSRAGSDYSGELVAGYTSPTWQVGLTQIVRVRVCDRRDVCSAPAEAEVRIQQEAPPSGDILSPRAAPETCIGAGNFDVRFRVSDPEGDTVTVTVLVGGVAVGNRQIVTRADGQPVEGTITVNAAGIPEGNRELQVRFDDGQGGVTTVNAGGAVPFDRTGPVVDIGAVPGANVCYSPNQVPAAAPTVNDNLDPSPQVDQAVAANGCERTLTVRATDRCGNIGQATRTYRLAEAVEVTINGANEGQLVASARMTWQVVGPAACAGQIDATLSRNGAAAVAYAANTLINQAGNYALTLNVRNCQNIARQVIRNFTVNEPPVAVAVPAGHPRRDPNAANPLGYIVTEGAGLQVDASESRAPEANDTIALYEWDFTSDGVYDAQGVVANYPTENNGVFTGRLRVTDSLGAQATIQFRVTVLDVDPVPNAGGPYVVAQGQPLTLDGTGSRAGSAADPISNYRWTWDDGTPDESGANASRPTHTWRDNGNYNVRLCVRDEDNEVCVVVRVEVRDVNPVIRSITPPADAYEIAPMRFTVDAVAGAPGDPITRIEWDFNGDGVPEFGGANMTTVDYEFRDAGQYTVTVRVRDQDSTETQAINVQVREITVAELNEVARVRARAVINDGAAPPLARGRLQGIELAMDRAAWGERNEYRGNTWLALNEVSAKLSQSQAQGGRFGNLLWALSRQFLRESDRLRAQVVGGGVAADHPSVAQADALIGQIRDIYTAPGFEARVGDNEPHLVRDIHLAAYNAYFYLRDATDPCNRFNKFEMPNIVNPVQRVEAANRVNDDLNVALAGMRDELTAYIAAGGAADPGPGRPQLGQGMDILRDIQALTALRIGILCDEGQCIGDRDALDNELMLMDLVSKMYEATNAGVYTRQWNQCLMLSIKFRIELSILRVEFVCGPNMPVSVSARDQQRTGLDMVNRSQFDNALLYYIDPDTRCLLIRTYNECLVRAQPDVNPAMPFPDLCLDDQ